MNNILAEQTSVTPPVKEEPEKIKKWREEQKTRLEEKGIQSIHNLIFKTNILSKHFCMII